MRVLFIDDDSTVIQPALDRLREQGHDCVESRFPNMDEAILKHCPDIIVLDLMDGGATGDPEGSAGINTYLTIWETRFCPIVVYSGNTELFEKEHPLIPKVSKGRGSEEKVLAVIQKLQPCAKGVNSIRKEVDDAISLSLRDLAPLVFGENMGGEERDNFQHMGRRRVAALLDDRSLFGETLVPWGQYIFPPLSTSPKQCDIIREVKGDSRDPSSYRLVLTPSCDLVKTETRNPKVAQVLCASCCKPADFMNKAGVVSEYTSDSKREKAQRKLGTILNAGFLDEYVPLPSFFDIIPAMTANLKKLELVDYESIANEEGEGINYIRIVSIDSPFREQSSWAYQNSGCRPGVPDRDLEIWTNDYICKGD